VPARLALSSGHTSRASRATSRRGGSATGSRASDRSTSGASRRAGRVRGKLRALLRSGDERWTIRLTPVGFRRVGPSDVLPRRRARPRLYRGDWYRKSKLVDRRTQPRAGRRARRPAAIAHGRSQGSTTPQGATHSGFVTGGGPHVVGGTEPMSLILMAAASAPPIVRSRRRSGARRPR
jgi:hypothetical protein